MILPSVDDYEILDLRFPLTPPLLLETTALRMNIRLARHKFEELQAGGTV
jgi:hypothetical protein